MTEAQKHHMELDMVHPSGAEVWSCPVCDRRFVMQVDTANREIDMRVITPGDVLAEHFGSTGGLHIHNSTIETDNAATELSEDLRDAINDALKDMDLDEILGTEN